MISSNPRQEHLRIANLTPEFTQIAEPSRNGLGSFVLDQVIDGQFVPLGSQTAIEADFSTIEALDNMSLHAGFEAYKEKFEVDPDTKSINEALRSLPVDKQELFITALFAVKTAKQFFSETMADKEKRDTLGWKEVHEGREDSYKIKKLSETADDGVCAEYSLVASEVMNRLGHDVKYTVGYRQDWPDEPGVYHAFLTSDETGDIIDVYALAQTSKSHKPYGLLASQQGVTIMQKPESTVKYRDIFGRQVIYSGSPIPVNAEQAAA